MKAGLVTDANFDRCCSYIEQHDEIIIDVETTGLYAYAGDKTIGIGVQTGDFAFYFPLRHQTHEMYLNEGETVDQVNLPVDCWPVLFSILSTRRVWTGHNVKFDLHFLTRDGMSYPDDVRDTMIGAHLFNENEKSFVLENLASKYIDTRAGQEEESLMEMIWAVPGTPKGKKAKGFMKLLHPRDVMPYACADVISTRRLHDFYMAELAHQTETKLKSTDTPLIQTWHDTNHYQVIIFKMEQRGIQMDMDAIRTRIDEALDNVSRLQGEIDEMAVERGWTSGSVNLNSSVQLQRLLNVPSSAKEYLELNMPDDPLANRILESRQWNKMLGSYYKPYLNRKDADNVLHPNFNVTGTISSRLSSSDPNMQAVPRTSEDNPIAAKVKHVFVARPGYQLIECDYSQAEMRLVSWYSQEHNMIDLIVSNQNMHTVTAQELGIPRDYAKRINFGVVYGLGKPGLSRQLRIPEKEAGEYLAKYRKLYPNFKKLYYQCQNEAEDRGYIVFWTHRIRHYGGGVPTHKAMSNLIQGGVAEMMRIAITRLHDEVMPKYDMHMLLQVHDSVVFEVADDQVMFAGQDILNAMEEMPFMTKESVNKRGDTMRPVPMRAEGKSGYRWAEVEPRDNEWRNSPKTGDVR